MKSSNAQPLFPPALRPRTLALAAALSLAGLLPAGPPSLLSGKAVVSRFEAPTDFGPEADCTQIARSMRVLNPDLVLGEPLIIEFKLRGLSTDDGDKAVFRGYFEPGRDLFLHFIPQSGSPFVYEPRMTRMLRPAFTLELGENATATSYILIAYDTETVTGALFDQAGLFQMNVAMTCVLGEGASPAERDRILPLGQAVLRVSPPSGQDKVAYDLIDNPDIYLALQSRVAPTDDLRAVLRQIVDRAPQSRLAPHALFTLANTAIQNTARPDGSVIEDRMREAFPLFREFLEKYPAHPFAPDIRMRLSRSLLTVGEREEAIDLFSQLISDPRTAQVVPPTSDLSRTLLGDPPGPVAGQWALFQEPADGNNVTILTAEQMEEESVRQAIQEAVGDQFRVVDIVGSDEP